MVSAGEGTHTVWYRKLLKSGVERVRFMMKYKNHVLRYVLLYCSVNFCVIFVFIDVITLYTYDFLSSGLLITLTIAALFCWHVQYKSVQGFVIMMLGRSLCQYEQNVMYFTAHLSAILHDYS